MLKLILSILPMLLGLITKLIGIRKKPERVEDILGQPEAGTYAEAARKAAESAAAAKYGPRGSTTPKGPGAP